MTRMIAGGPIRVGDSTTGGGRVVGPGEPTMPILDRLAVTRGMAAICCGGPQVFVEGCHGFDVEGRGLVLQGHRLSCGHSAISSCAAFMHVEDTMPAAFAAAPLRAMADGDAPAGPPQARADAPARFDRSTPAPPTAPAATGVTVHLGLFFDGTNNNAPNAALGAQCQAEVRDEADVEAYTAFCQSYKDSGSYEGAPTNVWKLHELFRESVTPLRPDETEFFLRRYIDGIGTAAGEPDRLIRGQGMGKGVTGVSARAEHVLDQTVREMLDDFASANSDALVASLVLHVFGFSRGATAARHFVTLVHRKGFELCDPLANCRARYVPGFQPTRDVRIGFVGLFDTVVNVGLDAATGDPDRARAHGLEMRLPEGCADTVVQLCAAHERRVNFPLTLAGPPHADLRLLPGAHGDIGGGYHDDSIEERMLIRPLSRDDALGSDPAASPVYREANRHKERWRPWLDPADPDAELRVDARAILYHRRDRRTGSVVAQPRQRTYATVRIRRRVSAAYTLVCLRVMHALAQDAGVPLELIDDNDPAMSLPDELQPISDKLVAYARGGPYSLSAAEEALLKRKYLHLSAHWNIDLLPSLGPGPSPVNALYVNRPTDDDRRVVYANTGGRTE